MKLKPFSGKARQSVKNCSNENLVVRSILQNGFKTTLRSKTNVQSVWKWKFLLFNFLSDKIETVYWKIEAKRLKLCKSFANF